MPCHIEGDILYLISYDVESGTGRRARVTRELAKMGAKRAQRSLWLISSTALDEIEIFDRLDDLIRVGESIIVSKIGTKTTRSRNLMEESRPFLPRT